MFSVTCYLHLWQNDGMFKSATAVTRGWNGHEISRHKVDAGEENSPPRLRDLNLQPFDHESGALPLTYRRFMIIFDHYSFLEHMNAHVHTPSIHINTTCLRKD